MPNQTIDLSRDLEAWYDFDTDYFDSQRGVIQDRSGHGRHASANGGPTVGVEGPDSFEAASFDGSDDFYTVPDINTFGPTDKFTISSAFTIKEGVLFHPRAERDVQFGVDDSNRVKMSWFDGSNETRIVHDDSFSEGSQHVVSYVVDGQSDTFKIFLDGEIKEEGSAVYDPAITGVANTIGKKIVDSSLYSGKMSFLSIHNRIISDAEVEYLKRLTAPRRSQL